ncbi:hypothetical protein, conserved [Babesia bigemina]|uniref:Uncharacterized protein n=1 Tax=Babesia bigemina TaxID=5866 RepID=A0A061DC38_BABBI|nr:hypothetical protein, conserved [Babesia bigemina]CDR97582.1 hypothetical protein, conserved [Babesia bigemina]|eukprot:XP_012769768.1 hypothetical protein, conserved [Babesia bigemina]
MASFNQKLFLQCFDQLADVDSLRRNQAVDRLLTYLALPPSASESDNKHSKSDADARSASKSQALNPLSAQRNYRFRFTVNDHNLLQYTVDRLLRGLTADRKGSRQGFTVALLSVLSLHGDNIKWQTISEAALEYTSTKDLTTSEVKDVLCGRLVAFFIIQKSGFFCTQEALPELEKVILSIWEAYDDKTYFQDASCVLLFLICRDVFRATQDVELALRHISPRLSAVLDANFVDAVLKSNNCEGQDKGKEFSKAILAAVGKSIPGVLPCDLLGLYLRMYSYIESVDKDLLKGTVLNKAPLDEDNFPLVLRYVSCTPRNHPIIGSFFDTLMNVIMLNEHNEPRLLQLWNSINLTMLNSQGSNSPQRTFTALRLLALIILKVRHSPTLIHALLTSCDDIYKTISYYHKASKKDPVKDISSYVLKLLVSVLHGDVHLATLNKVGGAVNPIVNDFMVFTGMNCLFEDASTDVRNLWQQESSSALNSPNSAIKKSNNVKKVNASETKKEHRVSFTDVDVPKLPADAVVDCLHKIASAVDFSASSLTAFQSLFAALIRSSADVLATYGLLESTAVNINIGSNAKRFYWLLSMLQQCVWVSHKVTRIELLKLYITSNALCASMSGAASSGLQLSIARISLDDDEFRMAIVSENNVGGGVTSATLPDETNDDSANTLQLLSKHMLNSCLATLSKALQALPNSRIEHVKGPRPMVIEIVNTSKVIRNVYRLLELGELPLVEFKVSPKEKQSKRKADHKDEAGSETLLHVSKRLVEFSLKLEKDNEDHRLTVLSLYYSTLALLLIVLHHRSSHLGRLSHGAAQADDSKPLFSEDNMDVIIAFAKLCENAASSGSTSFDSIISGILTKTLIRTIICEDNSSVFGLLHTISKGIWYMSKNQVNEELRDVLLRNSILNTDEQEAYDTDDESDSDDSSESESVTDNEESNGMDVDFATEENEDSEEEYENHDHDDSEVDDDDDEEDDDDDEEGTDEDSEEEIDEFDVEQSLDQPPSKKVKRESKEDEADESDLELSTAEAIDELLKDESGNIETLRMERMKMRSSFIFSPDSLKPKIRNLEMLQSCISECALGPWYLNAVNHLFSSYQTAVRANAGGSVDKRSQVVVSEYISKLTKVLSHALQQFARPLANQTSGKSNQEGESDESKTKVKFDDPKGMLDSLLDLAIQSINSQRAEKTSKACRSLAVAVLVFAIQVESMVSDGAPVQTTMVILVALLSICMFKKSRLSTSFFLQLCNRHPSVFASFNMVNISLESKVDFVQSEVLSVCASAVSAIAASNKVKPKRLCRRKCGKILSQMEPEIDWLFHGAPFDKAKIISFVTDNLVADVLKSLPDLLSRMKEGADISTIDSEPQESGKRKLKARSVSPQLAASAGRLVTVVVRSDAIKPEHKTVMQNIKGSMESLLETLRAVNVKEKQLQPLSHALSQLCARLGE